VNDRKKEFLIANIRSGNTKIKTFGINLKPASLEDVIDSYYVYEESLEEARRDGLMTVEEIEKWMLLCGFWTNLDEESLKKMNTKIEDHKIELYKNFSKKDFVEKERRKLRSLETTCLSYLSKKNVFYSNTCESYAESNRLIYLVKLCCDATVSKNKIENNIDSIVSEYQKTILPEKDIRFLCRTEPWKSLWSVRSSCQLKLFSNEEPTINQKNLVLWSKTYDGVAESYEPPPKEVIEDDDFLDGWFLHKSREREKESNKKTVEDRLNNSKIKSSQEVFIPASSNKEAEMIHNLNDEESKQIIRSRSLALQKSGGKISYKDFDDKKKEAIRQRTQKG